MYLDESEGDRFSMTEKPYPIVLRHRLPARTSFFESTRSRLKDIPQDRDDYAVVVDFDGHFELAPNGTPIDKVDGIRSARALVFVDIRPTSIEIAIDLFCAGNIEKRTVRAHFWSQVVSPEAVATVRIGEMRASLEGWARSVLTRPSSRYASTDSVSFEDEAWELLRSTLAERPPVSPTTIQLELGEVVAELPTAQVSHERVLLQGGRTRVEKERAEIDRHDFELLQREHALEVDLNSADAEETVFDRRASLREKHFTTEDSEAARLEAAFARGPQAVFALMAARNPDDLANLAQHGIHDRDMMMRVLLETVSSGDFGDATKQDIARSLAKQILQIPEGDFEPREIDAGEVRRTSEQRTVSDDPLDEVFDLDDDAFDSQPVSTESDEGIDLADDRSTDLADRILGDKGGVGEPDDEVSTHAVSAPAEPPKNEVAVPRDDGGLSDE